MLLSILLNCYNNNSGSIDNLWTYVISIFLSADSTSTHACNLKVLVTRACILLYTETL